MLLDEGTFQLTWGERWTTEGEAGVKVRNIPDRYSNLKAPRRLHLATLGTVGRLGELQWGSPGARARGPAAGEGGDLFPSTTAALRESRGLRAAMGRGRLFSKGPVLLCGGWRQAWGALPAPQEAGPATLHTGVSSEGRDKICC